MTKPKTKNVSLNQLAIDIAYYEGKEKPQNIAQIKETLNCLGFVLGTERTSEDAMEIVSKLIRAGKKE